MISASRAYRAFLVLFLSIATGGAVACGSQEPAPSDSRSQPSPEAVPSADPDAPPARPRIVALGDSLTAGLGLVETQSYPSMLQQYVDADGYEFEVVNAGVSGDTTAGGLRRLDWALEGDVRVVIVALGANDGLRGLSVAQMTQNLSQIIERVRAKNAVVILAGMEAPPNYGGEYASAFRQAFRDVALKHRVLFMPFLLKDVAGVSHLNQGDGIHPNGDGTKIVAANVWSVLRPLLDQMQTAGSS